jgi:beta-galactosidase
LNLSVTADIIGKPGVLPWSRSLFNGLAQIIVQSTKDAGEIKLTATADTLTSSSATVKTQPCTPRPFVP